jgi:hypothetical protein
MNTPTTEDEAINLCIELSAKFKFQVIFIQKDDFGNQDDVKGWTQEKFEYAMELATEEVADQVGSAILNAIETTNDELE